MPIALNATAIVEGVAFAHDFVRSQPGGMRYAGVGVVLLAFYLISRLVPGVVQRLGTRIASHTETKVDDELIRVSVRPLRVGIMLVGILAALFVLGWSPESIRLIAAPLAALAIVVVARIAVQVGAVFLEEQGAALVAEADLDARFIPTIQAILSTLVYSVAALMALATLGVNVTPLLTLGGIAGLAVAVASQDTLGNLVAGVLVMYEKPFATGDIVTLGTSPSGENSGTVVAVGLFSTKVRTWDNNIITLPNSEVYKRGVLNYSLSDPRTRLRVPVGVAYGSDVEKVRSILLDVARGTAGVVEEPAPKARFMSFGDFAYNFELFVYLKDLSFKYEALDAINTRIKERFDEEGVEIPFPVRELRIVGTGGAPPVLGPARRTGGGGRGRGRDSRSAP